MEVDDVKIGMGSEVRHSCVQALMKGEGAIGSSSSDCGIVGETWDGSKTEAKEPEARSPSALELSMSSFRS